MSPKAVGVHSNWGFSVDALCNGGMFMEWDQVHEVGSGVVRADQCGGHRVAQ